MGHSPPDCRYYLPIENSLCRRATLLLVDDQSVSHVALPDDNIGGVPVSHSKQVSTLIRGEMTREPAILVDRPSGESIT